MLRTATYELLTFSVHIQPTNESPTSYMYHNARLECQAASQGAIEMK